MKKILAFQFSPREAGNCAALSEIMAEEINDQGKKMKAQLYTIDDLQVNPCKACAVCKKQDTPSCAQKDDFAALIPALDACDGIIFATPIYFGRIPGAAKNFVDRLYCFFNPAVGQMFTPKASKKLAVVMSFGAGDENAYQKEAEWLGGCFKTIGITDQKNLLTGQRNALWNDRDPRNLSLVEDAKALAHWIIE